MKKLLAILLASLMSLSLMVGCSSNGTSDSEKETSEVKTIKIGVRSDMVDQVESVRQRALDGGYDLDAVIFNDSVQPNVALAEGSIDINWYQHEPYLLSYNESNGTDLVMIKPKTFYPLFAMYSEKWKSLEELPDGATIGLCNDATNKSRALFMLQDEGLIKLDESVESPTEFDIKENPHKFKFIEAEMSVLPQSISDCDAICLAAGHMVNAGKSIDNPLCESKDNDTYAVGMVVRAEDKDAQWAADLAKLVQCDELAEYFKTDKQGTQVPAWE
ncbi:metal ABC transporter substrate-binding protein [Peptacetobacter hominis]|uniref:Metal ABC transporter substrate-binding protein n=1 Tax=Peptacetobacter hominis TaxID=2743610 RepID=A0A544QYQ1_9FIRM|nr:MetQ/NlpA family ABC transporter substrate-binding protein [Peptacetobacter hominis]TQQ85836.1 metal ABC transporter substrate-binding protein [Peptacetobacter hominis]